MKRLMGYSYVCYSEIQTWDNDNWFNNDAIRQSHYPFKYYIIADTNTLEGM